MNIAKEIGLPALLGQAAEECAELAKALLKYQRILMGTNPTPVTEEKALSDIKEEAQDVKDCLRLLDREGVETVDLKQSAMKMERWEQRIREEKGKKNE